jgi:hypothetical protein
MKTIEERTTRVVHAAGEAEGRTLCGLQVRTVRATGTGARLAAATV